MFSQYESTLLYTSHYRIVIKNVGHYNIFVDCGNGTNNDKLENKVISYQQHCDNL